VDVARVDGTPLQPLCYPQAACVGQQLVNRTSACLPGCETCEKTGCKLAANACRTVDHQCGCVIPGEELWSGVRTSTVRGYPRVTARLPSRLCTHHVAQHPAAYG
jgi:hypothetical protein